EPRRAAVLGRDDHRGVGLHNRHVIGGLHLVAHRGSHALRGFGILRLRAAEAAATAAESAATETTTAATSPPTATAGAAPSPPIVTVLAVRSALPRVAQVLVQRPRTDDRRGGRRRALHRRRLRPRHRKRCGSHCDNCDKSFLAHSDRLWQRTLKGLYRDSRL